MTSDILYASLLYASSHVLRKSVMFLVPSIPKEPCKEDSEGQGYRDSPVYPKARRENWIAFRGLPIEHTH